MNISVNYDQLSHLVELAMEAARYEGTYDTVPFYDEFLSETFGNDWHELCGEWDDLHYYEFDVDFFIYLSTGVMSKSMEDWISQGKELLQRILLESETNP